MGHASYIGVCSSFARTSSLILTVIDFPNFRRRSVATSHWPLKTALEVHLQRGEYKLNKVVFSILTKIYNFTRINLGFYPRRKRGWHDHRHLLVNLRVINIIVTGKYLQAAFYNTSLKKK